MGATESVAGATEGGAMQGGAMQGGAMQGGATEGGTLATRVGDRTTPSATEQARMSRRIGKG